MNWLLSRLREPSTYTAVAVLGAVTGINIDPGQLADTLTTVAVVSGALGIGIPEAGSDNK